jgi:hypothetical protein
MPHAESILQLNNTIDSSHITTKTPKLAVHLSQAQEPHTLLPTTT